MISVIIPSRSPIYLQRTIDDLLEKAEGEIEIIVVLDGYWPDPILKDDPRVVILHAGTVHDNIGMRAAISQGMAIAKGEYVMKIDEHCLLDQGYDLKLTADCEDNWMVVPRRYRLDPEKWEVVQDGRPPIDYMYLEYPYVRAYDRTCGLHGVEWKRPEREDILIDDTMSWQGSCYFAKKSYWEQLFPDGMDSENYGTFTQEAQEIGNKVWLTGGRLVVNKKTWYAHWHKGKRGKGYGFSTEQYKRHEADKEKGRLYCIDYWINTKDYLYDFDWLLKRFDPPSWPINWREQIKIDAEKDWSKDPSKQPTEWLQ